MDARTGESLLCEREPTNFNDRCAVSVVKNDIIVGHLPGVISRICSLFLLRNGTIDCTRVTLNTCKHAL